MTWVADKDGRECIYQFRPKRGKVLQKALTQVLRKFLRTV